MRLSNLLTRYSEESQKKATLNYIKYWKLAREKQVTPLGDWNVWLILAGRGLVKLGLEHMTLLTMQ